MLVARRDPFHPGAQDNPHSNFDVGPRPARAPRLLRAMSALQMAGTLLAIPLGIGSAYTMYRANFSPETTCQSLRASIVLMLDKNVDAHTRHMLARHDVEAFEKSCADVDPDATAAFKTLLSAEPGAKIVHDWAVPVVVKQPEEKPKDIVRKVEPAPTPALRKSIASESRPEPKVEVRAEAKSEPMSEPKSETKSEPREATVTDTAWLAAVRGALAAKEQEVKPVKAEPDAPVSIAAPPYPPAAAPIAPPVAIVAPPLPPAANIATAPTPKQDPDHPVPPASIPEQLTTNDVVAQHTAQPQRSSWIGHIPLVGKMLDAK